ncbi:Kinetochore-Ndc80 subunit Spc24 [Penicillium mononematosum]|uniref:Kinetochore-Ndc80 subunit Spc24 n=1 Tax=Penicillium mononematosum TaxID=268346 RepID=UPI00254675D2|nr:Kinetochore-Ndc80 subunit Spc24 [Penicillium mononematosum]KAJ6188282.1 Kinetochore-Ndc80 subunit Spc24 [Penicillium mononematosum]
MLLDEDPGTQSRDLRIREAEAAMRKLSRHLNSLSTQHEEAVAVHDSGKHAAEIVELDTKKFRIAKAASELEIESERLESELEILKERLVDLRIPGSRGRRNNAARALRLKIFRSLGVDIEPDEAGNFNRAVIRNSRKGDVHVVNIDPKFSRFFYANYFWSTMQG